MNNDDFKEESDYIDVLSENKKEVRNELIKNILRAFFSLLFIALICFGGYIGVKNLIPKVKDSKLFDNSTVVDPNTDTTDSGVVSDNDTSTQTDINKCMGTYSGFSNVNGVDYDYSFVLNEDNTFSALLNEETKTGNYSVTNNTVTFTTKDGDAFSYKTDSDCSYLIVEDISSGFILNKK